jgi:predicted MFS family arabinose efflux permease
MGHLLFAAGALSLLFWLTSGGHRFAWLSAPSLALAGLAAVSLSLLYWHENRHPDPFLAIDLLRNKAIGLSAVLVALFACCLFAMVFFLPIYLQLVHRVSAQLSGLLLIPVTGGMVIAAIVSSRVLGRTGDPHWIPVTGMSISAAALLGLGLLPPSTAVVAGLGFLTGVGFGTVMPTTNVLVQSVAGRQQLGAVTAMASLARSTGGAAGAALFGAVVFALMPHAEGMSAAQAASSRELAVTIDAFHRAFLCAAGVAALAAFTASRIPRVRLWEAR